MLENHLKVLLRTFRRHPQYAILNLTVLSLGMAGALYILLYLHFEINYDRFHPLRERIYRVETAAIQTRDRLMEVDWQTTPVNLVNFIGRNFPEIESWCRFYRFHAEAAPRFIHQNLEIREENVYVVDSSALNIFDFELIAGDPSTALSDPNQVVLSEELAHKFFGQTGLIGQTLRCRMTHQLTNVEEEFAFTVSGIFKNLPANTHLDVQVMISPRTDPELANHYFGRFTSSLYVLLAPNVEPSSLEPKFTSIYDQHLDPSREAVMVHAAHKLLPLSGIHQRASGGTAYLYIFGGIATLLILIAFISYINIATAQGSRRSLEIGVRKILGSNRAQLSGNFLAESIGYSILSFLLALLLLTLSVGPLNRLFDLELSLEQIQLAYIIPPALLTVVALGTAGGIYPALFLSSFRPLEVISGNLAKPAPLRRFLLCLQFAVVIFVLAGTVVIYRQMHFVRNADLGFEQEQVLQVQLPGTAARQNFRVLEQKLESSPLITGVSGATFIPGAGGMVRGPVSAESSQPAFVRRGSIGYDYLDLMGIDLLQGRNFSSDFPADSIGSVLVNEEFLRTFDLLGEAALGAQVKYGDWGNPRSLRIIGVVEDFHQSSLHSAIEPQLFRLSPTTGQLVIKVQGVTARAIEQIEQAWQEVLPGEPLEYHFLDGLLLDRYRDDQRRGRVFLFFSLITAMIAFGGLFGLSSYLARQRMRELSIRRIFGATGSDILLLLSRDFLILVLVACIPGVIGSWWTMNRWLENFSYQAPPTVLLFLAAPALVVVLTLLTVGVQTLLVARRRPTAYLQSD